MALTLSELEDVVNSLTLQVSSLTQSIHGPDGLVPKRQHNQTWLLVENQLNNITSRISALETRVSNLEDQFEND